MAPGAAGLQVAGGEGDDAGGGFSSSTRRGGRGSGTAQLEVLDWLAYIKRQRASDYTSTNTNFFPKVDPDDAYYRYFHSKGGANELSGGYANPAADKLLEEGESTVDAAKRAEVYRRRVELIADEVPVVTTGLVDAAIGWRAPVESFEPHNHRSPRLPQGLPHVWLDR